MIDRTSDEIAEIFSAAGDSVTVINADASYSEYKTRTGSDYTEDEWKSLIQRNVEHLEIIKNYKKVDNTTSIWTSEDFTAIDALRFFEFSL